ncbi:glycosyltransferase family protein [Thermoflexibacter ruber]|uniref:Uncharacterized protein n=1 Tax=Thermoflexibacter ruber TaxID=1003 RepID=A0A1I2C3S3_9BACT|nr:hypothetical protein [Thermoflexibacter ruber]SFE62792.1 hypothetical protein SAMN04488541_100463 [Thermoflexibacter ruber]
MKKHVLVTTFWSFKDALVQTYTLPYLRIMHQHLPKGSTIYLLTIEQERYQIQAEELAKIEADLKKYNIVSLRFNYYSYGFRSLLNWVWIVFRLFFLIWSKNIRYIHSFCTTSGMSGYLLSILTGRTYLIDSYEPHAEASVENGDWKRSSFRFRLLFFLEKLESKRAKYIISATEGMRKYALEKYNATFKNFYVKPACVDLALFSFKNRKNPSLIKEFGYEGKIVCVYAGKFGGIYLDKEIFEFFKVADTFWGEKFRLLVLTSHQPKEIEMRCKAVDIDFSKVHVRFVNHSQIPDYMGLADFGVTPVKPIPTKRYCTPVKDGEYWALGLPIVITRDISDDSEIVEKYKIGSVMYEFTASEYLRNVQEIDVLLQNHTTEELYYKVRQVAEQYRSFEIAEKIYKEIYGN